MEGTRQRQASMLQRRTALRQRAAMTAAATATFGVDPTSSEYSLSLAMAAAGGELGWDSGSSHDQYYGGGTRNDTSGASMASPQDDHSGLFISGTVFSAHSHVFFPAILDVLLPPPPAGGADEDFDGMTGGTETAQPPHLRRDGVGTFHYVLRDLCIVLLTAWGGVFERAGGPGQAAGHQSSPRLLHHDRVAPSATRLMRHLILVSPSASSDERKANVDTVRMLLGKWGAVAQVSASDFLELIQPQRRKPKADGDRDPGSSGGIDGIPDAKRVRQGSAGGGGGGAASGRVPLDHQLLVALKLLSTALFYGQGDQLLRQQDAGRWIGGTPWASFGTPLVGRTLGPPALLLGLQCEAKIFMGSTRLRLLFCPMILTYRLLPLQRCPMDGGPPDRRSRLDRRPAPPPPLRHPRGRPGCGTHHGGPRPGMHTRSTPLLITVSEWQLAIR